MGIDVDVMPVFIEDNYFSNIITNNTVMRDLFEDIRMLAAYDCPVLITGETGTGKELLARAVHDLSLRGGDYLPVNVGAVDDTFFSDLLFGHTKGAFTGANDERQGMLACAVEGTLFLDEIGELSDASQIKLLRVIENREYYQIGANKLCHSNARLVMATNVDPTGEEQPKKFREDLYHRLKPYHLRIPPLRERLDDLPLLLDHFIRKSADELGKARPRYTGELLELLNNYAFPGNVRELQGMVKAALLRHKGGLLSTSVFKKLMIPGCNLPDGKVDSAWISSISELPTFDEINNLLLTEALRRSDNNQSVAATMLGVSASAVSQRLSRIKKKMEE